MADLPYGFDRADGLVGRLGTATPAGAIRVQENGAAIDISNMSIQELPDSPTIERAEQATITHVYRMSWSEAVTRIGFIGRGAVVTDSTGNYYLVLSASIQHEQGGSALFTLVCESKSFDSPPDEFSLVPVELGVNILKHPRYFYAFFGDGYGSATELQNQMVIRILQDYFENTSAAYRDAITELLNNSFDDNDGDGIQPPKFDSENEDFSGGIISGTNMAKAAALEIVQKFWRGEETPYIVGYEMTWSQYFFVSPWINPGGYVEDPMTESVPQLPEYFFSRVFPPSSGSTIFDFLASINPQCYSSDGTPGGLVNISWLRKSDQVDYQRTWFKLTATWVGSPVGYWDADLYTHEDRPSSPSDYRTTA